MGHSDFMTEKEIEQNSLLPGSIASFYYNKLETATVYELAFYLKRYQDNDDYLEAIRDCIKEAKCKSHPEIRKAERSISSKY